MGWIAPVAAGVGAIANTIGGISNAKRQKKQSDRVWNESQGMMQGGPSIWEQLLQNFIPGMSNVDLGGIFGTMGRSPTYNAGQDALMQVLRGQTPPFVSSQNLSGMAQTGNPFDTSAQFNALAPIEARQEASQLAQMRSQAGSLGQRFGSAYLQREADMRANLGEQANMRRSTIAQQAYEAAQGRMLNANQLIDATRQQGIGNLLQAIGLGQQQNQFLGDLMLRGQMANQQNQLAGSGLSLQALAQGLGGFNARNQYNAGLLGLGAGQPVAPSPWSAVGQGGMDLGTMMLLLQQMGGK